MSDLGLPFSSASLVLLAVGAFIPLVTTLLTKWTAPDWVKNAVTAGLAMLAAAVQQALDVGVNDKTFTWVGFGQGIVVAWAAAAFAYVKLWRGSPPHIAIAEASSGFGADATPPVVTGAVQ